MKTQNHETQFVHPRRAAYAGLMLGLFIALLPCVTQAIDATWDGGSAANGAWTTGVNWNPNQADNFTMGAGSTQTFNTPGAARLTNWMGSARVVGTLNFTPDADSDIIIATTSTNSASAVGRNLTINAAINVDAGANANITIGNAGAALLNPASAYLPVILTGNILVTHNGSGNLLINVPITGSGFGMTKAGSGTFTLSGNNTYSGATTISGGTLKITGGYLGSTAITFGGTGTLAVQPGSPTTIAIGGTGAPAGGGTLTLGSGNTFDMAEGAVSTCLLQQGLSFGGSALTANDGATFKFDLSDTTCDQLTVTTAAAAAASGTVYVTLSAATGATSLQGTPYTLITAGAGSTLDAGATWALTSSGLTVNGVLYKLMLSQSATDVTVTATPGYAVTYDGNGNTGGTAPVDGNSPYLSGDLVTVLGNTGSLTKNGYIFNGWNTAANGSGTAYIAGNTFNISAGTTLYAQWLAGSGTISASPILPISLSTTYGTTSSSTSVSVSGSGLVEDITATAPTGLEVSSDDVTYGLTAIFTQSGGNAGGTLYVRLKNNAPAGDYNSQNINLSSMGATPVAVATTASGNTVATKALTIASGTAQSKMYDDTTIATVIGNLQADEAFGAGNSGDGKPYTGDALTVVCAGSTFASSTVGADIPVTARTFTLDGASAGNYTVTQPSLSLSASILDTAVWTNTDAVATWSTTANWTNSVVATNRSNTADFNQVDLLTDTTVSLTTPLTIGNLIFGDTETSGTPASWTLGNNAVSGNILTLNNGTNAPTITVNPLGAGKSVTISAVIASTNGLTKAGSGTLALGAVNSFTGTLTISNGTVKLGVGSALPGVSVSIYGSGMLDLNGFLPNAVNSFNGDGTVDNSGGTARLFAIGNGTGSGIFSGIIQNTGAAINLTKFGTGNITLSGLNAYTGVTKLSSSDGTGTLTINTLGNVGGGPSSLGNPPDATTGTISLGNGGVGSTLVYIGAGNTSDRVINLAATVACGLTANGSGPLVLTSDFISTVDSPKTFNLKGTSTATNTIAGQIVDYSGASTTTLVKSGTGTWVLGGANSYTGATTVSNGTLLVNGSLASGAVTVAANGTLGGNGVINGAATNNGTLSPGVNGVGTLTFNGDLALTGTTRADISLTGGLTSDLVVVGGNTGYGGPLVLTNVGVDALTNGAVFHLFSVTGSKNGNFSSVTVAPGSMTGIFDPATGNVTLTNLVSPTLAYTSLGGGVLQFTWTGGFKLQWQTNALSAGLGNTWVDYPSGNVSPVNVTNDSAIPTAFFRLAQ